MESKHSTAWNSTGSATSLLIEPVWNRNMFPQHDCYVEVFAFNRTSMESKLHQTQDFLQTFVLLLIEPVWNRNKRCPVVALLSEKCF